MFFNDTEYFNTKNNTQVLIPSVSNKCLVREDCECSAGYLPGPLSC